VPSTADLDRRVVAFDPSITEPYATGRANKYEYWHDTFKPALQARLPDADITFVVLYSSTDFTDLVGPASACLDESADPTSGAGRGLKTSNFFSRRKSALNDVWVVDRTGCQKLGVAL
jgi:hypothetical protein